MSQEEKNIKKAFTSSTQMANVIHTDYRLIPIIGRFGINYGFGNKTIEEVCQANNINIWFFLEIINSYHNPSYFPKEELKHFTIEMIVKYLSSTHSYYMDVKIPEIQNYINEMQKQLPAKDEYNIKLLNDFFKAYKRKFISHIEAEDQNMFPYVVSLEQTVTNKQTNENIAKAVEEQWFNNFESNHTNIETSLSDLKNLIIRHLPPIICKELCQKLLLELYRLEEDIEEHLRIEEKVLAPKVKELEKQFTALQ